MQRLVIPRSHGAARIYELNRPRKLNALNEPMIHLLRSTLEAWDSEEACNVIVGTGKGRAFCAGGDVIALAEASKSAETRHKALSFMKHEYELNYFMGTLSKPYVVLMNGITMGGGMGLSMHAPFRIASENTIIAMPETRIGFYPDVGANHFLPRLKGQIGTYLVLTGADLRGRAVFEHGVATHFIRAERLSELVENLAHLSEPSFSGVEEILAGYHEQETDEASSYLATTKGREGLEDAFSHDRLEQIVATLRWLTTSDGKAGQWAKETLAALDMRSPTALKVALEAIRRGKQLSLAQDLVMEMRATASYMSGVSPDFLTGVDTVVAKKDSKTRPAWSPASLSEVPYERVVSDFFEGGEGSASASSVTVPVLALDQEREERRRALEKRQRSSSEGLE
ncbi:ClpP/crotonase [Calocera viscosa TUFC12733]|uniref:3-hydroxyisobutyryl-CoA hydrolase n=1 Tax=Calocera viscosa (strain TUFC12733) TaxID=1330018 RepID=A0A167FRZ6_CALVF|nr:ClpP/crotonase [Calocera viscosa TUFC12733]